MVLRISWRLARADHVQGEIDDAGDGVGSPPAEAAPAVPAEAAPAVPVVHAPEQKVMSKFLALHLVYGRGQFFWLKLFSATEAVPSDFLQKAPMQQSSLLSFAAVGAGTTGHCQPLDIATMCVFKLKQILHRVMTILWKTVVCTNLRPGRQLSAQAVSVLPDLDGEPPLFFSTAGQHPHGFRPFSCL